MAHIFNYVYALLVFLSLFLMVTNGIHIGCDKDRDCPKQMCHLNQTPKCLKNICKCV
ncbi:putative Late nodulin [Medicago truncatula]|uniref:Late nodulin n=1 Tax=Medicago truncatula TaxID=3880 RepID=A7KHB2_MEDTR|nr:nodule-specific cysteine-rich peptide 176 [Medicago truncatula]AES75094.1 late nodulin [Medicago truncatula]RHN50685.1 putative Late nodulin [Medicago truncatula]